MTWPFDRERGLIVVPAIVHGPSGAWSARLVLDTGAVATVISSRVLATVGCEPVIASQRVQLITASGIVYAARLPVDRIDALGHRRSDFPVVCHELPPGTGADGVLGLDFLRGHRLVVDFPEGLVSLE